MYARHAPKRPKLHLWSATVAVVVVLIGSSLLIAVGPVRASTDAPGRSTSQAGASAWNLDTEGILSYESPNAMTYTVTFTETGLTPETNWSAVLNGSAENSSSPTIVFTGLTNGTHSYTIEPIAGYTAIPASGSVMLNGADVSQPVTFTGPPSNVTITPTSGPAGTTAALSAAALAPDALYDVFLDAVSGTPLNYETTCTSDPIGALTGVGGDASCTWTLSNGLASGNSYSPDLYVDQSGDYVGSASSEFTLTTPNLTVAPGFGPASTEVATTATALAPSTQYDIYFDLQAGMALHYEASCTTNTSGALTGVGGDAACSFPLASVAAASYIVDLFEDNSGNFIAGASSAFALTTPVVTTLPTSGAVGTAVALAGTGLAPITEYDIYLDVTAGSGLNYVTTCTTNPGGGLTGDVGNASCGFAVPSLPGGAYSVDVFEDVSGNYVIAASSAFMVGSLFPVTLTETGLPAGTSWSVTLNGANRTSTGSSIEFNETNGTYNYSIGGVPGWHQTTVPYSGFLRVNGSAQMQLLAFTASTYVLTFGESGLAAGTLWYVNLTGGGSFESTQASLVLDVANGTYPYTVATGAMYESTAPSGSASVAGAPAVESISFIATFAVTFNRPSGTPSGSSWTVYLNSTTGSTTFGPEGIPSSANIVRSSTAASLLIAAPNGTYTYAILVLGNPSLTGRGSVSVQGSSIVANPLSASPSTFLGLPGLTGYYIVLTVIALLVIVIGLVLIQRRRHRPPAG